MDAARLKILAHTFAAAGSRRSALVAALSWALSMLGLIDPHDVTAASRTCKPACGACQTCKTGRCRKTMHGKKRCTRGKCQPTADGTACAGGVCQGGRCGCASGLTACGGVCINLLADPRNCGNCGTRCRLNEQCLAGTCGCPAIGGGTREAGYTCCPATNSCKCSSGQFVVPATCTAVASCPAGSMPCIAASDTCGFLQASPSRVCCPSGTTCAADGTCLL